MTEFSYEELAQACFDNDSLSSEHGINYVGIIDRLGQNSDVVRRVAEQRSLRLVIALRSIEERGRMKRQAFQKQWSIEDLDDEEVKLHTQFTAVWMDGFATLLKVG